MSQFLCPALGHHQSLKETGVSIKMFLILKGVSIKISQFGFGGPGSKLEIALENLIPRSLYREEHVHYR
jgi:hypothetical protein